MRTSEIAKRPVVTLGGEDVGQIKDIVYSAGGGAVGGFTLAGRGLFAGPGAPTMADVWRGRIVGTHLLDGDLRVDLVPLAEGSH